MDPFMKAIKEMVKERSRVRRKLFDEGVKVRTVEPNSRRSKKSKYYRKESVC